LLSLALASTAAVWSSPALLAQNASTVTPQGSAKTDPGNKKILGLADIGRWKRINSAALSSDGKWMTYIYAPNEGDDTLFIKQLDGDKTFATPRGTAPQFSDDGRYVGYFVSLPTPAAGRGGRAGGGGRGAGAANAATPAPGRQFELLDLASGAKYQVPEAATFKFAKGSKFLAVRTNKANAAAKHDGADLVLRELASGITQNIGNVNLYDFDDAGGMLAYTVDAADRIGNGIYVVDLGTSQSKVLNSSAATYDQLEWGDKSASLAVLRGNLAKGNSQRDNTLLVWRDVNTATPKAIEYDPSKDAAFPKQMVLSELGGLRWARDGSRVFVGLKAQEPEIAPSTEPRANVDVWHWKDDEVQSVQIVRFAQESKATLPAAFDVASTKLVRLADDVMRNVTPTPAVRSTGAPPSSGSE
jgi:hypothetical protein